MRPDDEAERADLIDAYVDEVLLRLQELSDGELERVADDLESRLAGAADPVARLGPAVTVADQVRAQFGLDPWEPIRRRSGMVRAVGAVVVLSMIGVAALAWTRFLRIDAEASPLTSPGALVRGSDAARFDGAELVVDLRSEARFEVVVGLLNQGDAPVTLRSLGSSAEVVFDAVVVAAGAELPDPSSVERGDGVPLGGFVIEPGATAVLVAEGAVAACAGDGVALRRLVPLEVDTAEGARTLVLFPVLARGVGCGVPSSV